jgi:hypothetical protein
MTAIADVPTHVATASLKDPPRQGPGSPQEKPRGRLAAEPPHARDVN